MGGSGIFQNKFHCQLLKDLGLERTLLTRVHIDNKSALAENPIHHQISYHWIPDMASSQTIKL
jgi:hypothetical protein